MTGKSNQLCDGIDDLQWQARRRLDGLSTERQARLAAFRPWLARTTMGELCESNFLDLCAEALAWTIAYSTTPPSGGLSAILSRNAVYSPFLAELLDVLGDADLQRLAVAPTAFDARHLQPDPLLHYELYLANSDPQRRLDRGVFYTPRVVARHIVEQVDLALRERLGLADGLADTATWGEVLQRRPAFTLPPETGLHEPFVRILDPASGSGIFLIEVVDRIYRTMQAKWRELRLGEKAVQARWNAYVSEHLLPRLHAVELLATPCVISQLALAQKLADTGYDFSGVQTFRCSIANTLLEPATVAALSMDSESPGEAVRVLRETLARVPFTVVLGNPPFRGISNNTAGWIGKLLRGTAPDLRPLASYYEVDGEPLRERKLWLQDDYVKFFRYAQWQIERSGAGVIGFVTNHGYLDNTTFRGMRQAMLETFQQIDVLDLQGNRKKNKAAPDGSNDEGLFEIEQGVAIGIFSRTLEGKTPRVTHREVWGKRAAKARVLAHVHQAAGTRIDPQTPNYLFVPMGSEVHPEYEAGFALHEVMPVNSTAVVTARDSFVVGFDRDRLAERMRVFCDRSISDAEIRGRFFTNTRSRKYPPGDTRGWKLAEARRRMMQESDWASLLRDCLYRPFDRRVICWADWMIDWPRPEITRHLLARPNLALVARRQMPPTGGCDYFWITDTIALDGLIRSDNRGSESLFPLWLDAESPASQVNLSPQFVDAIATRLRLTWNALGPSAAEHSFSPLDVLHYIYGLFSAPAYRSRYQQRLRRDFPRVLLPRDASLWRALRDIGASLAKLHLGVPAAEPAEAPGPATRLEVGYPKFAAGRIWLGSDGPAVSADERVWNFRAGTHQVCRKWLRDRGSFTPSDLDRYRQIVAAVAETVRLADCLDAQVVAAGGWAAAFSA